MRQIKYLAARNNLTLKKVAEKIGVKADTVYKWSQGTRSPRSDILPKLAEVLDCTYDELLDAR